VLKKFPEHFGHVATQAGFELASIRHDTRKHPLMREDVFLHFCIWSRLYTSKDASLFLKPFLYL